MVFHFTSVVSGVVVHVVAVMAAMLLLQSRRVLSVLFQDLFALIIGEGHRETTTLPGQFGIATAVCDVVVAVISTLFDVGIMFINIALAVVAI